MQTCCSRTLRNLVVPCNFNPGMHSVAVFAAIPAQRLLNVLVYCQIWIRGAHRLIHMSMCVRFYNPAGFHEPKSGSFFFPKTWFRLTYYRYQINRWRKYIVPCAWSVLVLPEKLFSSNSVRLCIKLWHLKSSPQLSSSDLQSQLMQHLHLHWCLQNACCWRRCCCF